jgi:hypothetical protein
VRIVATTSPKPLLPGGERGRAAWSEYRYWAYSYVLPR